VAEPAFADSSGKDRRRISLEIPLALIEQIDALRREWGHRNRGDTLERLLQTILSPDDDADDDEDEEDASLHESGALVLVTGGRQGQLVFEADPSGAGGFPPAQPDGHEKGTTAGLTLHGEPREGRGPGEPSGAARHGSTGIDLPGFVRQKSVRLRQSLRPPQGTAEPSEPLPRVAAADLEPALTAVREHWLALYGTPANEAVLEAAMVWLAREIWPQSDQSEGRPFTWTLLEHWILGFVPSWPAGPASFERVIVAAGFLEDPFSSATLSLRIPTLIRRFVHRFRRRPRGTSFETLEHTMTLQGALRLLELPTTAGHRLTLREIREAYREQAMNHHPDSGGSADAMRRLNEAYQLLKELYRKAG
jgi:hypothetical protein